MHPWLRFRLVALGHAPPHLEQYAELGGVFLIAAETFTLGARNFRLPGLGAYLQTAAQVGDVGAVLGVALLFVGVRLVQFLAQLSAGEWLSVLVGVGATLVRVTVAFAPGALWTIPLGVAMGTSALVASVAQPVVQVVASTPATALFPIIVVILIGQPGGLNVAAILLMLLGTQWYILFNVIAGTGSITRDLYYTAEMLGLGPRLRWRTLTLPAIFPYRVTGLVTASSGACNASIVAGSTYTGTGGGALIAEASATANDTQLLAATLSLVVTVVAINRLL